MYYTCVNEFLKFYPAVKGLSTVLLLTYCYFVVDDGVVVSNVVLRGQNDDDPALCNQLITELTQSAAYSCQAHQ